MAVTSEQLIGNSRNITGMKLIHKVVTTGQTIWRGTLIGHLLSGDTAQSDATGHTLRTLGIAWDGDFDEEGKIVGDGAKGVNCAYDFDYLMPVSSGVAAADEAAPVYAADNFTVNKATNANVHRSGYLSEFVATGGSWVHIERSSEIITAV